jgi:carboxypeptidase C (cathepsin A)
MLWGYSDNWIFSEQKPWLKNSTALGNYKTFRNFTYVNVYGVGHVFGFENTQGS